MFTRHPYKIDFENTRAAAADSVLTLSPFSHFDLRDPIEQMRAADAADRTLLRLVVCAATATLVLALASSLGA